jgi:AcrR family transcriptional regulator
MRTESHRFGANTALNRRQHTRAEKSASELGGRVAQRGTRRHSPVQFYGSERQRQIVKIVLDLVSERGADSVSIQAIADEMGVTQPAVFRHFPNKEAIWVAVMDWLAERLRQIHSAAELRTNESPLAILRTMFLDHIAMIRRYPALAKVVFSDHLRLQFPPLHTRFANIHNNYEARVVDLIRRAKKQKLVPASMSEEDAATMYFCMVQGLGFQFSIARRPMRLQHKAERVFTLYLRAVSIQ